MWLDEVFVSFHPNLLLTSMLTFSIFFCLSTASSQEKEKYSTYVFQFYPSVFQPSVDDVYLLSTCLCHFLLSCTGKFFPDWKLFRASFYIVVAHAHIHRHKHADKQCWYPVWQGYWEGKKRFSEAELSKNTEKTGRVQRLRIMESIKSHSRMKEDKSLYFEVPICALKLTFCT